MQTMEFAVLELQRYLEVRVSWEEKSSPSFVFCCIFVREASGLPSQAASAFGGRRLARSGLPDEVIDDWRGASKTAGCLAVSPFTAGATAVAFREPAGGFETKERPLFEH